ncbi:MAG TPA: hypothetical protein VHW64_02805, partial [Nocardioides sp.]|uniref:hypothetical protein n=1 Tax=Nocardioides sp. TaxID=35761 RepID=UPI002E2F7A88
YEVWMTAEMASAVCETVGDEGPARNAFIESGLIHARSLFEFFVPKAGWEPDSRAMSPGDYAREWVPTPVASVQRLHRAHTLLNSDVAHLSWEHGHLFQVEPHLAQDKLVVRHIDRAGELEGGLPVDLEPVTTTSTIGASLVTDLSSLRPE